MKKSQLRAISHSYAKKREQEIEEKAKQLNIFKLFNYQSGYKTLRGFVDAYGTDKFVSALKIAEEKLTARINQLKRCNAPNCHIEEAEKLHITACDIIADIEKTAEIRTKKDRRDEIGDLH